MSVARVMVIIAGIPLKRKMARYRPDKTKIGIAKATEAALVTNIGNVVRLLKVKNSPNLR
jgi:hypothetical protein